MNETQLLEIMDEGLALQRKGRLEAARAKYQQVLDVAEGSVAVAARFNLGVVCCLLKRWAECVEHLTPVVQHDPHDWEALYSLAWAEECMGKRSDAIFHYRSAAAQTPTNPELLGRFAFCLISRSYEVVENSRPELIKEAEKVLNEAQRAGPRDGYVLWSCAHLHYVKNELKEALKLFLETVSVDAGFTDAHFYAGIVLGMLGRFKDSADRFTEAIRTGHDTAETWFYLGVSLYHQNKFPEARSAWEKTILKNPCYKDAYYNLFVLFHKNMKNVELALDVCRKGIHHFPDDERLIRRLADVLASRKRWAEVLPLAQKLASFAPEDGRKQWNLGVVLERLGSSAEAEKAYGIAIHLGFSGPKTAVTVSAGSSAASARSQEERDYARQYLFDQFLIYGVRPFSRPDWRKTPE